MSVYCTDCSRDFDDFLLHRMGDTLSVKNYQNLLNNQDIKQSRYDSTAFSRIIDSTAFFKFKLFIICFQEQFLRFSKYHVL